MSMELFDAKGSIGQAATNTGMLDAAKAVEESKYAELKLFFETGKTTNTKAASTQAFKLAHEVKNNGVRSTLINISNLLKKAKEFAVVQTG